MSLPVTPFLTVGDVAERLGVEPWQVRYMYQKGLLPPAQRVGQYRAIPLADVEAIATALRVSGYLSDVPTAGGAGNVTC